MGFYRKYQLLYIFIIPSLCVLLGCTKNKLSAGIPEDNLINLTNSNIRIFNISGQDMGLIVNNTVLALRKTLDLEEVNTSVIGRQLFPDGVFKNRSSFSIPTVLLSKTGGAYISVPPTGLLARFNDTLIQNDPVHPKDYYLLPGGKMVTFPRNNTPPADPRNFKVRIVNLGDPNSEFNVGGPVTLTNADGSLVDPRLNGIANGQSSEYAELPYGAYQFKLFAGAGAMPDFKRQLVTDDIKPARNACIPGILPQEGFMPPVQTFKPGGVYTVMVISSWFMYDYACNGLPLRETLFANAYQIITDLDPGANLSYARINAVNTIPGKKIIVKANGKVVGNGPLPYIGDLFHTKAIAADYLTVVQGEHSIEALDESGNVLAETTTQFFPFDNITIWVRADQQGKATIVFSANDMTNTIYKTGIVPGQVPDDGTNGEIRRLRFKYAWQSRFMNFCNELPVISFSNSGQLFLPEYVYPDTLRFPSAYRDLSPGIVPQKNGNIIYRLQSIAGYNEDGTPNRSLNNNDDFSYFPNKIWVNNTAGGLSPGILLTHITPITCNSTFTANEAMYSTNYTIPPAENGIYTMALVGGQSGAEQKLVVIKHNK